MKSIPFAAFLAIALLIGFASYGQSPASVQYSFKKKKVSFVTVLKLSNATKDGFYMNGYVINISHERGPELDGKKIRVSGKVSIVKGVKNDSTSNELKRQGRASDYQYIDKPKIEVLSH